MSQFRAPTEYGNQQLSLFNAHYGEWCFMPVDVYDAQTGRCVVTILRPGGTSDGKEGRAHLRRLVRRIRLHWHIPSSPSAAIATMAGGKP